MSLRKQRGKGRDRDQRVLVWREVNTKQQAGGKAGISHKTSLSSFAEVEVLGHMTC